jgi:hypothetical protein
LKTIDLAQATKPLASYVEELKNKTIDCTIVVTVDGKPVLAVVPVTGLDSESLSLSTNPKFLDLLERSREERQQRGGMSSDEVREHFKMPRRTTRPDG